MVNTWVCRDETAVTDSECDTFSLIGKATGRYWTLDRVDLRGGSPSRSKTDERRDEGCDVGRYFCRRAGPWSRNSIARIWRRQGVFRLLHRAQGVLPSHLMWASMQPRQPRGTRTISAGSQLSKERLYARILTRSAWSKALVSND